MKISELRQLLKEAFIEGKREGYQCGYEAGFDKAMEIQAKSEMAYITPRKRFGSSLSTS